MKRSQLIAHVGRTDQTTGSHVHVAALGNGQLADQTRCLNVPAADEPLRTTAR